MKKIFLSLSLLVAGISMMYGGDQPAFPGGADALKAYVAQNTRYPQMAKESGVEGIVVVGFIVGTDGSLSQMKVIKMVDPDLEKEALRVVSGMPAWIPADKNGTPVAAPSKVEIPFILE